MTFTGKARSAFHSIYNSAESERERLQTLRETSIKDLIMDTIKEQIKYDIEYNFTDHTNSLGSRSYRSPFDTNIRMNYVLDGYYKNMITIDCRQFISTGGITFKDSSEVYLVIPEDQSTPIPILPVTVFDVLDKEEYEKKLYVLVWAVCNWAKPNSILEKELGPSNLEVTYYLSISDTDKPVAPMDRNTFKHW